MSDGVEKGRWMGPQAEYGGGIARKVGRGFPYFYITFPKKQKCLIIPDLFSIINLIKRKTEIKLNKFFIIIKSRRNL